MNKIERIHQDFRKSLSLEEVSVAEIVTEKTDDTFAQKANRLHAVGFGNSKTAKEAAKKKVTVRKVDTEHAAELASLEKLQAAMPEYRLIGLNALLRLCEKYGLYIGHSALYTHGIPEKNLAEIEKHRNTKFPSSEFSPYLSGYTSVSSIVAAMGYKKTAHSTPQEYFVIAPRSYFQKDATCIGRTLESIPKPKFNLNFGVRPFPTPDPIVVTPINTSKTGVLFQIATAWGKEADDTEVTTKVSTEISHN
jgi:hypothetical protein